MLHWQTNIICALVALVGGRSLNIDSQFPWLSFLLNETQDIAACSVSLLIKVTDSNTDKFANAFVQVQLPAQGTFFRVFTATGHGNKLMRRVVFNANPFVGEQACLQIIDHTTTGHINVTDFQFSAQAPQTLSTELGGGDPDVLVWGFADLYTHPMAHLAFGGTIFWGKSDGPMEEALA